MMLWSLVLVGCLFGVLALSLQHGASSVASAMMASLCVMDLQSGAAPVLRSPAEGPLLPVTHLVSLSAACGTPADYDIDDADASAMFLLTFKHPVLAPIPVGVRCQRASHASFWPTPYFVRPQLLSRL